MSGEKTTRRANLPPGFPLTDEQQEQAIALAPDRIADDDRLYDDDPDAIAAFWKDAIFTPGGGYQAVRAALAERRRQRASDRETEPPPSVPE